MNDQRADSLIATAVEHAVDHLMMGSSNAARTVPRFRAEEVTQHLASQVRQIMESEYELALLTTDQVAAQLRISPRRVRALAVARQIGWQAGRGVWVFRPQDVDAMRVRIPGRPRLSA